MDTTETATSTAPTSTESAPVTPTPAPAGFTEAQARAKAIELIAPKAETVVEIKGDDKAIAKMASLEKESRELRKRLEEYEKAPKTNPVEDLKSKYKTSPKQAIAELSGTDADEELTRLLAEFVTAEPKEPLAPELTELQIQVAALKKERDDELALKEKSQKETTAKQEADQRNKFVTDYLTAQKDKYPRCARNQEEILEVAIEGAASLCAIKEIDPVDVTPEIIEKLLGEALAELELELADRAKRYSVVEPERLSNEIKTSSHQNAALPRLPSPGIRTVQPAKAMTEQEARQRAKEKFLQNV
jgi:hypothetical protein